MARPGVISPGRSFALCTARWASPRRNACSSSAVKSPLPPAFSSDHSAWRSPVLTTLSSSVSASSVARKCDATSPACARASGLLRVAKMIFFTTETQRSQRFAESILRALRVSVVQSSSIRRLHALDILFRHPRHHATEALAGFFDDMLLAGGEQFLVVFQATLVFFHPFGGEFAGLDFFQDFLHLGLGLFIDDARAAGDVAVLGGFRNGEAHAGDAALVHQVADELQLVEALEIRHFRLVTGLDQRLKTGLDERAGAAAKHGLLAEEISLGLLLEGGLEHAGAGRADALGPGERELFGLLRFVLGNRHQRGHALTLDIKAPDHVARALGRDHDDVDVRRRLDQAEMDAQAVGKQQAFAGREVGGDILFVNARLLHVGQADHDDVGATHGLAGVENLESVLGRDGPRLGAGIKADDDLAAGVLEVKGMGMALGAIAEHGEGFIGENAEIGVLVGVDFGGHGKKVGVECRKVKVERRNRRLKAKRQPGCIRTFNFSAFIFQPRRVGQRLSASWPVRASSTTPKASIRPRKADVLPSSPVISMMTASWATLTILARKMSQICMISERVFESALTLMSTSSRPTAWPS